jgi:hypothetical protein
MSTSLARCAEFLTVDGVRHHVDGAEAVIRIVFVTQQYLNQRGEKLAVLRLETPDDGHRCRVSIERAFPVGSNPAATCLKLCRLAAATPLVAVEYDEDFENLRMICETVVEDGEVTRLQLLSMIDRLVEATEWWHGAITSAHRQKGSPRGTRGRAKGARLARGKDGLNAA